MCSASVVLAEKRRAAVCLVTADFPRAGQILASYLHRMTAAVYTVQEDMPPEGEKTIRLRKPETVWESGNPDGFSYYVRDGHLFLEALNEQAAVWAVYDFLEKIGGCRYYTPLEEDVPFDASLTVTVPDTHEEPVLSYREVYYRDYFDPSFAEKHKMTAEAARNATWGFWCHSFNSLLPPSEYFDEHPEYFALRDGKRTAENAQPCLSNPDVLAIMTENLRKEIEKRPECRFWSVSQNDNGAYCTCEKCRAIDEEEGSPMGSVLRFVNQIAEQFPDKTISTLAYWYTRKPPKIVRPAPNVHIMLCNIEANRGLPIETDAQSAGSREELLAWKDICPHISLWDYCIQFRSLAAPFPNLRVIPQNIRFFVRNNVKMLFSQANREYEGEFSALRGYLLAKCMWNPDVDAEAVLRDFCEGYYGAAAEPLLTYIRESTDAMEAAGGKLGIFGTPQDGRDTWLSETQYARYMELAGQALAAVSMDADRTRRVKTAVLPLWYAGMELQYGSREEQLERIRLFEEQASRIGLEKVEEWHLTTEQYIERARKALE